MKTELLDKFLDAKRFFKHGFDSQGNLIFKLNGKVKADVSKYKKDCVLLYEEGTWKDEKNQSVKSYNSYQINFSPDKKIQISHLRYGIENPVNLVELEPEDTLWKSNYPHLCEGDQYSAELHHSEKFVQLNWQIKGKDKNYTLNTIYF